MRVPLEGSRMCEGPGKVALTLRLPADRSDSFVVFLSRFEDGMLRKRPVWQQDPPTSNSEMFSLPIVGQ